MAEWYRVASTGEIDDDDVRHVVVDGHPVGLYRVEGKYYAIDDICTHAFAMLSEGFLEDFSIECPLHQGRFDIRNGKALDGPVSDDVTSYPVKVEGGFVLIEYGELASPDSG